MPEIRPPRSDELDAAHACYRRNEYTGTIQPDDDPLVAVTDDGDIVGVVRIAHEHDTQILRGMFLDEAHRGRGLGTRMITVLAERMRPEPCWVICGPHLIGFLIPADAAAPAFLQERVAHYRDTYGPQCLLRRSG